MEEILKQILDKVNSIDSEMKQVNQRLDRIEQNMSEQHIENIEADNRLLEAIRTTNDRLDFQRDKLSRAEEELYLLKQKQ